MKNPLRIGLLLLGTGVAGLGIGCAQVLASAEPSGSGTLAWAVVIFGVFASSAGGALCALYVLIGIFMSILKRHNPAPLKSKPAPQS